MELTGIHHLTAISAAIKENHGFYTQTLGMRLVKPSVNPTLKPTDTLLTRVFNMRPVRDCPHPDNPGTRVHVFEMGAGGPHAELHVAVQPDLPDARQGAGSVHHVGFRTPDAR